MEHQIRQQRRVNYSLALLLAFALSWGLTQPAQAALAWQTQTVDSAGDVGQYTSLKLDSIGRPVISYFDRTNGNVKLVRCGNATCSSSNSIVAVDNAGPFGGFISLALDSSGNPVISYWNDPDGSLKLAHCGNATCSSGNSVVQVDNAGDVGRYTSLALDSSGNPVISYYDRTNRDLKLAHCGNATCSSGNSIVTVDSAGDVGQYTSLELDSSGNPVISYYDFTNEDLKLVHCGNATCSSGNSIVTVDSAGDVGQYASLELDSSGNPVISYFDNHFHDLDINNPVPNYVAGKLKLVHCSNIFCLVSNSIQIVESAGYVGQYTSLELDSLGNPVISYFDGVVFHSDVGLLTGTGDLKLAHCGNIFCLVFNSIQAVDSAGVTGKYTSLALDSLGNPVISYYDDTNGDLKLARLGNFPTVAITEHSPDPSSVDQAVLVRYSVTPAGTGPTPTGTVFVSDGVNSCLSTVASGQCSLILETAGTRTLTASYAGDSTYAEGSASVSHTVNRHATTTSITADSPDPSNQGQAVTVSYSVVATDPSKGTPSGNVTVSDGVDSCTGTVAAGSCALTLSTAGARTLTATYAGNTKFAGSTSAGEPHTVSAPDSAPPTANPSQSPAANGAGWNSRNVVVTWNWSDPSTSTGSVSGIDTANCTNESTSSGEGTITLSATCQDLAGNTGSATYPVKVDKTAPIVTITGVSAGATYTLGSVPTAGCSTTDTPSGVATPATLTLSGGNGDGTGIFEVTCSGALDNAGNGAGRGFSYTVIPPPDTTAPLISPNVVGTPGTNGWYIGNVAVSWSVVDNESAISSQSGCEAQNVTSDTTGVTFTCSATSLGGTASQSVTIKRDATAPTVSAAATTQPNGNGWYNSNVTVQFTCNDNLSGVVSCPADQILSSEGNAVSSTAPTITDQAGNSSAASNVVSVQIDKTAPTISAAATTQPNAAGWYNSNVTVHFTCADELSGVVSCPADEVLSSEGSAVNSTAPTVSDLAGNQSATSNVVTVQIDKTAPVVTVTGVSDGASYILGSVPTAACSTSDALAGVATQATVSVTGGGGDGTGSFTATCSGAMDNAGNSAAASSVTYTVVDACTTLGLLDNFNRANGSLGSNWAGATGQSFYKVANNGVDVQLGGPVVWKPTTYGVNQAAFVTLSTLDPFSPAQGVLLKVQTGTIPNAGAIAVVYDNLIKAVRVSTLRLNTPAWTTYGNTPATFANGDKLLGCVKADGTVRVYRNNSLLTTVTLNAADQSFFNAKGGKIGLWTVAAPNLFVDDFGGGALAGVTAATLDASVADETADDGTEITVAENFPTDDTANTPVSDPAAGAFANHVFLPQINR